MNFRPLLLLFILRAQCTVAHGLFSEIFYAGDSFILSEIITNFLLKYFINDPIFISIVISPSLDNQSSFQNDFFGTLFDEPALADFPYNILQKLDNSARDYRNAFNLILVDDQETLT